MFKRNLPGKLEDFKAKFSCLNKYKKKLKAIINYNEIHGTHKLHMISLLQTCLDDHFLDREEAKFLEHLLLKIEGDWKLWTTKTRWLKSEMVRIKKDKQATTLDKEHNFRQPDPLKINSISLPIMDGEINKTQRKFKFYNG